MGLLSLDVESRGTSSGLCPTSLTLPHHALPYQAAVQAAVVGGDAGAEDELRDGIEAVRAIGLSKGKGENKG